MSDILQHGRQGLLTPVNDHEAIARAALDLLEAPDLARQFAREAHATCAGYTWTAARQRWLPIYRSASVGGQRRSVSVSDAPGAHRRA
jgi:phosphatidylinositol alpha-mannosyltransferase